MKKSSGTISNAAKPRPRRVEARDEPSNASESLTIGALAKAAGVNVETIRSLSITSIARRGSAPVVPALAILL